MNSLLIVSSILPVLRESFRPVHYVAIIPEVRKLLFSAIDFWTFFIVLPDFFQKIGEILKNAFILRCFTYLCSHLDLTPDGCYRLLSVACGLLTPRFYFALIEDLLRYFMDIVNAIIFSKVSVDKTGNLYSHVG